MRNLQTIAESTQRLSDGLRETEPDTPWRAIAGFRNVPVHDYFDFEVVWSVVDKDLPKLVAADSQSAETGIAVSDSVSGSVSFERQMTPPCPTRRSDFLRVTNFRACFLLGDAVFLNSSEWAAGSPRRWWHRTRADRSVRSP